VDGHNTHQHECTRAQERTSVVASKDSPRRASDFVNQRVRRVRRVLLQQAVGDEAVERV
jgi:hypothetical protein